MFKKKEKENVPQPETAMLTDEPQEAVIGELQDARAETVHTDAKEPESGEPDSSGYSQDHEAQDPVEAAYCLGAGIDSETLARAKGILGEIAETVNARTFNPEMLQLAIRMLRYDEAIDRARNEGRAEVQTERIEEAARRRRTKADEASALPHLSGTKGLSSPLGDSIFEIAKGVR